MKAVRLFKQMGGSLLLSWAIIACSGGNGADGAPGKDGDSCHITDNGDGSKTISCPDGSSFNLTAGVQGEKGDSGSDGAPGQDGDSCHISDNGDGTKTISCPDGSSFVLTAGPQGEKGDSGSDGAPGQNGQSCFLKDNGDGTKTLYCPYDGSSLHFGGEGINYCLSGYYGSSCQKCDCVNGICNDTTAGDGSCRCHVGWAGPRCDTCASDYFGITCEKHCQNGQVNGDKCACNTNFVGELCDSCTDGWFGDNCDSSGALCTMDEGSYNQTGASEEICTIKDKRDGSFYHVVAIGKQLWLRENLRYNGEELNGEVKRDFDADLLGFYYTFDAATAACPKGFRLPSKEDWFVLAASVQDILAEKAASDSSLASCTNDNYDISSCDDLIFFALVKNSNFWKSSISSLFAEKPTDITGFGAMPGGYYPVNSSSSSSKGTLGLFWTSTPYESNNNKSYRFMFKQSNYSSNGTYSANDVFDNATAFSVRCMMDLN